MAFSRTLARDERIFLIFFHCTTDLVIKTKAIESLGGWYRELSIYIAERKARSNAEMILCLRR